MKTISRPNPAIRRKLESHVQALRACTLCPRMHRPAVSGGAVVSRVISVGQAPGTREPVVGRPFAWTAGRTLFGWFERICGMTEEEFGAAVRSDLLAEGRSDVDAYERAMPFWQSYAGLKRYWDKRSTDA